MLFAKDKQDTSKKSSKGRAKVHIPKPGHLAVGTECPVALHGQWAALGHLQGTRFVSAGHGAAKLQGAGLHLDTGEVHFSPQGDALHKRMAPDHVYLQHLLCFPALKILFISRVKHDVEMTGLPYIHSHRLQGDEQ